MPHRLLAPLAFLLAAGPAFAQGSFVNFETPHVHPLDLTPDGSRLLAVNTPDGQLEIFSVVSGGLIHEASVPVGVDPVSVRARTADEAWVVNHVSDSISVVSLQSPRVIRTIETADEPCDVVFAGTPTRAFVTCSQANLVQVFDPLSPLAPPQEIQIVGEDPRALAVSPDGSRVFAAIFESGNNTTVLGGGATDPNAFPPNVVNDPAGPWGGQNPPPNDGNQFKPPIKPSLPPPPKVSLIVRKDDAGKWMDDNGGDWTAFVSGPQAAKSGRPVGWDLADHDVAVIDANTLAVVYARGLLNLNMALAPHPTDGRVAVVGTDATNEVRFEPNLKGVFLRVEVAFFDPVGPAKLSVVDLNPHLTYAVPTVPQSERDKSIGDPRGIVWHPSGSRGYVTGMGSNNVVVIDPTGSRAGQKPTIEVGEGPTGIVYHAPSDRLFVLNKFASSISIVDVASETELAEIPFHDASPQAIKLGRKHLYGTHENSGLGHIACASCHIDARMDRLAWDLGDPQGDMKPVAGQNLAAGIPGLTGGFEDFHPMKGPMTTQTLQDIIGKEPLHWRGDRDGLEEFNGAFIGLQGDDQNLSPAEMQEFEDFLQTIHFPPNPFRNLDNSLPTSLDTGHNSSGRFSPKGTPLPPGDATRGLQIYRPPVFLDSNALACSTCHTLPTGLGTDSQLVGLTFQPFPVGPNGEHHHALVSVDGFTNVSMKIPHLRNQYEKIGFDTTRTLNTAGFGFVHDGSVDTIAQFVSEPVFTVQGDQDVADLTAFMMAFSGSDLPYGGSILEPPATPSQDAHAATGRQTTLLDSGAPLPGQIAFIDQILALADQGAIDVVAKGRQGGIPRGYAYLGSGQFQSDRAAEVVSSAALKAAAAPGSEITFTAVPAGSGTRIGIDRDEDGALDRDELDAGSDPEDPVSVPGCGARSLYGAGCAGSGGFAPSLDLLGCIQAGGTVTLSIEQALGGSQAVLLFGLGQGVQPLGGGCAIWITPVLPLVLGPLPLSGTGAGGGSLSLQAQIPASAGSGAVTMQAFCADPAPATGFSTTQAVRFTLP